MPAGFKCVDITHEIRKNSKGLRYCYTCKTHNQRIYRRSKAKTEWPCEQCGSAIKQYWLGSEHQEGVFKKTCKRKYCEECAPSNKFYHTIKSYGVDKTMWDAMYFDQDGECAIESCTREAIVLDHNHKTGKVRALMCLGCNGTLGFVEDLKWTKSALAYLKEHNV